MTTTKLFVVSYTVNGQAKQRVVEAETNLKALVIVMNRYTAYSDQEGAEPTVHSSIDFKILHVEEL